MAIGRPGEEPQPAGGPEPDPAEPAAGPASAPAEPRGSGAFWRELVVIVLTALVISSLVKGYVVQTFFIPSGSMETTLHGCPGCHGDRVLVNKFVYRLRDPRRGEVVVFRGTASWPDEDDTAAGGPLLGILDGLGRLFGAPPTDHAFIKRVIAVPGDTVQCCDAKGRVTVNRVPLDEPYLYENDHHPFGPRTLKPGELWMMGDHRGDSSDSRYNGPIPMDHVVGRAFAVIWPLDRWRTLPVPATFGQTTLTGR